MFKGEYVIITYISIKNLKSNQLSAETFGEIHIILSLFFQLIINFNFTKEMFYVNAYVAYERYFSRKDNTFYEKDRI